MKKEEIIALAKAELEEEKLRKAIDKEKERLTTKKKTWFPWKLIVRMERR